MVKKAIFDKEEGQAKRLRDESPGTKYIDELILENLKEEWLKAKTEFVKMFYHRRTFKSAYSMDCFIAYMEERKASLFNDIMKLLEGFYFKVPKYQTFKLPTTGGSTIPNKEVIASEMEFCTYLLRVSEIPDRSQGAIRARIYAAYGEEPPVGYSRLK